MRVCARGGECWACDADVHACLAAAPLAGIYDPEFIAANQESRVDNIIKGTNKEQMAAIQQHIRDFKADKGVDQVVVRGATAAHATYLHMCHCQRQQRCNG